MPAQVSISGVHHITVEIPRGGEEEARTFYGRVLGLTEIMIPEALQEHGGVWFACGEQQLHIGPVPRFEPQPRGHPAFLVDDLTHLQARLHAVGAAVEEAIQEPGWVRCYGRDPFGNRLEFRQQLT